MRPLLLKIKPTNGFDAVFHSAYRLAIPLAVFILVRLDIGLWLPMLVILLSKWRIFSVRPRFWPAILRANSVDIMVGVATVLFMVNSESVSYQLLWALLYGIWLIYIKPSSSILMVSLQASIGQVYGLMALFLALGAGEVYQLVFLTGLICYLSARHFFDSFNEPYAKMLSYLWGYFGAALTWVLAHMLVVYPREDGLVAQPALFIITIGYSLGAIYYLEHFDKLSALIRRELLFLAGAIVFILVISLFYEGTNLIV